MCGSLRAAEHAERRLALGPLDERREEELRRGAAGEQDQLPSKGIPHSEAEQVMNQFLKAEITLVHFIDRCGPTLVL